MRTSWLIGMLMLFTILTIVSGIIEQTYLGADEAGTIWGAMSSFQAIEFTNPLTAVGGLIIAATDLTQALFKAFIFNYSFLTGIWFVFRILGCCISAGIVVSLILAIRGVSSG